MWSAGRALSLSTLTTVKNSLSTSMSDDTVTLTSLLVLAAEKDLMMQLSTDDNIAHATYPLAHLYPHFQNDGGAVG